MMHVLSYKRTDLTTGDTIEFNHRCRTEAVLVMALDDYTNVDENLYSKHGLKVLEVD